MIPEGGGGGLWDVLKKKKFLPLAAKKYFVSDAQVKKKNCCQSQLSAVIWLLLIKNLFPSRYEKKFAFRRTREKKVCSRGDSHSPTPPRNHPVHP